MNQIDHEESDNRGPETQGFILCDSRRIKSKKVRNT